MTRIAKVLLVLSLTVAPLVSSGADKKDKFLIRTTDNILTILQQEIDLPVKLQLRSGAQISGTVTRIGVGVVQISEVSGMELFDAVVKIDDISAVLFRARKLK